MTRNSKLKYEQAIEQIEQIIEGIESGDTGLEESLAQYEKGMKLLSHCRGILGAAEKRIVELTKDCENNMEIKEIESKNGSEEED